MEDAGLNLPNRSSFSSTVPSPPPKAPITCHVLDLVTGRPAPSLAVSLTLLRPYGPSSPFKALTNADGRISNWHGQDGPSLREVMENLSEHPDGKLVWSLKFETGEYYGEGNTFFPEVEGLGVIRRIEEVEDELVGAFVRIDPEEVHAILGPLSGKKSF